MKKSDLCKIYHVKEDLNYLCEKQKIYAPIYIGCNK